MRLSVKFYFSHYQQKVEVSVFPSQVNQLYFEKEFTFIDQLGDLVTCNAKNFGDYTESVTTGGRGKRLSCTSRPRNRPFSVRGFRSRTKNSSVQVAK